MEPAAREQPTYAWHAVITRGSGVACALFPFLLSVDVYPQNYDVSKKDECFHFLRDGCEIFII